MTSEAINSGAVRPVQRVMRGAVAAVSLAVSMVVMPVLANAAPAKPACLTRKEHEAEQLVRLHTEMMLVGLTCQSLFPEEKTFEKYHTFTVNHRKAISEAEGALISHFQRTTGAGTRNFDLYRTELANQSSRRVGVIGSWSYCQQFIPRASNAVAMSGEDLKILTSNEKEYGIMELAHRPLCDVKVASLPDPVGGVEPQRSKNGSSKASGKTAAAKPAAGKPAAAAKPAATKPASGKPAAKPASTKAATKPATTKKVTVAQR